MDDVTLSLTYRHRINLQHTAIEPHAKTFNDEKKQNNYFNMHNAIYFNYSICNKQNKQKL